VEVTAADATYTLLNGEPMEITHHGEPVRVSISHPRTLPIPETSPALGTPTQPPGREPVRRPSRSPLEPATTTGQEDHGLPSGG
jgi:alpha,alpha-trehalose phosphorylase